MCRMVRLSSLNGLVVEEKNGKRFFKLTSTFLFLPPVNLASILPKCGQWSAILPH
ncbi:unnamed protein product [Meloidogyne enterolobii]|uniref:Uncharacterized protein n=1 Tax=Meloidogyne enterolobii TaxID=390850 RepID=A0ACB1A1C9_MELEN